MVILGRKDGGEGTFEIGRKYTFKYCFPDGEDRFFDKYEVLEVDSEKGLIKVKTEETYLVSDGKETIKTLHIILNTHSPWFCYAT